MARVVKEADTRGGSAGVDGSTLWFFESLDRVNRAIGASYDFDELVAAVLSATLDLFDCDRALLVSTSGDPWRVVKCLARPGHAELSHHPLLQWEARPGAAALTLLMGAPERPLPDDVVETIHANALMAAPLSPTLGEPYALVLHTATIRTWNDARRRLFEEVRRRLTEALTHALTLRTLRQSERRLDAAQRLAHVGYWERDLEAHTITLSDEACQIFGFSPDERIVDLPRWHTRWVSLIHPEDQARTADAFAVAAAGGLPYDVEYRVVRPSGETRIIHSRCDIVRSRDGAPLRALGVMQDITEKKVAEQALVESNALLSAVVEGTSDPIFIKDLEGRYLMVNAAGARSVGLTVADVIGKHDRDLFAPEKVSEILARDWQILTTGEPQTFRETRSGDATRLYLTTKGIVRDHDGKPRGVYGICREITELMRLESQLLQAQKLEAVGQLAGGIAHDFNNLLTIINSSAELATNPAETSECLADIAEAGRRAAMLTRQLLVFSRRQVLDVEAVDVNKVIERVTHLLRRTLGEHIELSTSLGDDPCPVRLDASQFEQVIINLAINARDAMPDGGRLGIETKVVEVSEQGDLSPGRYACVVMTDSGIGMDSGVRARIFEPFFTTKPVGRGTGLGLSMAYGFIRQSGGHIEVESEPGCGTTFRLLLPAAPVTEGQRAKPLERSRDPRGHETILLVEDDHRLRRLFSRALSDRGYRVIEASDGKVALDLIRDLEGIDLLVTDVIMPRLGGLQLASKLRERWPHLKVLLLSGYPDDVAVSARFDGRASFLQKPFLPLALAQKVREAIEGTDHASRG